MERGRVTLRFTSNRERRIWIWVVAIIVAIYSTLGLARVVADELDRRDLADAAFGGAFVLILLAIIALGLRMRPGGLEVGIAVGVIAVYVLVFVRMAIPEERTHVVEYGVVAILVHEALVERLRNDRPWWVPATLALGLTVVVGTVDEVIQLAIPSRVFDVRDILTNAISALLALVAKLLLVWANDRRHTRGGGPAGTELN